MTPYQALLVYLTILWLLYGWPGITARDAAVTTCAITALLIVGTILSFTGFR